MLRTLCAFFAFCSLLLVANAVSANCNIQFESDISVSPEVIKVSSGERDMVIGRQQTLYVDYEALELNPEQQALLARYAEAIRGTMPAVISIALEGAEIGLRALTEVLHSMFGGSPPAAVVQAYDDLHRAIDEKVRRSGDEFYLARGQTSSLDTSLDELGPVIEQAVAASIGSLFTNIGALFSEGEGSLDLKFDAMVKRMEELSARIEETVGGQAAMLRESADGLCVDLKALEQVERELIDAIPEVDQFRIVRSI